MKAIPILQQIRPHAYGRLTALPLFGSRLEEFCQWLHERTYKTPSLLRAIAAVSRLDGWLRRRGRRSLREVTEEDLRAAHDFLYVGNPDFGGPVRAMGRFLRERSLMTKGPAPVLCPTEIELTNFGSFLRGVRGLADSTILGHQRCVRSFLRFLKLDHRVSAIRTLHGDRIEGFLRLSAKSRSRSSLQNVVAALRAYLKHKHSAGFLREPLHQRLDMPRVYGLERLPRALPWEKVSALLGSIDRSEPEGERDFMMLYLTARYGLRRGEVIRLRLDDIDWRGGTLTVHQTKTKQSLVLPLTDETGDLLCHYLRTARPASEHRELFLRARAPAGPLMAPAVYDILRTRIRQSGLGLSVFGVHTLRHSLAGHLLRQGVSMKLIGDALGHRSPESTSTYLRLAVDDLRQMGLPVPRRRSAGALLLPGWKRRLPRVRPVQPAQHLRAHCRSMMAASIREYLELQRALGRAYRAEETTLRHWDDFIFRHFRDERRVLPQMFHRWADSMAYLAPTGRRGRLLIVRNFLLFHQRRHPDIFIPDLVSFPRRVPYPTPYLVSSEEMGRLLPIAARLPASRANPLRGQTARLALVLLYCCGLRRGELMRLRLSDVDRHDNVLRIERTKFHKSRLVPLSPSVSEEVHRYLRLRRRRALPMQPDDALIWSPRRSRCSGDYVGTAWAVTWQHLCLSAGVVDHRCRPPRLHDLRHSFAVAALHRCYARGRDPQSQLPHLAAYLGHVSAASTYHYLHLTPDLQRDANRCFYGRFGNLLGKGGVA
jgi:integrase/recombinase XerD